MTRPEADRDRLVDAADAGTNFAGQEFAVILPAPGAGQTQLFGGT